ncbi:MAG: RagB/SusD family nutrient uptake outer membrane protein [Odoribacteraceae bacterium]|jgi:hypothetical protein|nr:RagB/SusD family nutrient uptake outer membrane protein [Odoribacteraceae bacterium]
MKRIYYILALLFPLASCNEWLDFTPPGAVDEDKMFEDERGFQEVLAGSYSLLTSPSAYGMELTAGFPDEIARYWAERSEFFNFKYEDAAVVGRLASTWNKMYETIANLNLLLDHAKKWTPETMPHYNLIVGEAKGLRAYLHLDLLRLFGPVLPDGIDRPAIPYRDEFSNNITRQMTAREVLVKIETDLTEARTLLVNDPIHENGRSIENASIANDPGNKAFAYIFRGIRMNYHAVCATLARYHLLTGNKPEALARAKEVIDAKEIFQLGNAKTSSQDYMFQPELVWALYDAEIDKSGHLGNTSFSFSYSVNDAFRSFVYKEQGYGLPDDSRLNHWWGTTGTTPAMEYLSKYFRVMNNDNDVTKWEKVISMIRLSELYYIAAEALIGTDNAEARRLLQEVRNARNLSTSLIPETLSGDELLEQILAEQRKEFWGEGKLFYTYKRLFHDIIIRDSKIPASRAIFELPVPKEEIEYGNN